MTAETLFNSLTDVSLVGASIIDPIAANIIDSRAAVLISAASNSSTTSSPTREERQVTELTTKYQTLFDDYSKVCDELATVKAELSEALAEVETTAHTAALNGANLQLEVARHNVTKLRLDKYLRLEKKS